MIPYNPSSFNSNKTILEQILEIKKWLIAHPSYKVYYCTSNFMPTGDDDRAFTEIAGTEEEVQNIAVGDLLVFPDAYYSEVIAVDLDNEMVTIALPATNFSGPQGATGPSGADGTNGTCIRYCNTNKNSNPSTTYAVSDITFSTGLQINDCILFKNNRIGFVDYISGGTFRVTQNIIIDGKDGQYVDSATINSDGDLIITLYDPESMIQSNINVGHVVGADGNDGVSITNVAIDGNDHLIVTLSTGSTIDAGSVASSLEGADIKSTGATSGQVLTADGSNGASWQTPGGSGPDIVTITTTTGTFSDADFAKVQKDDTIIIYVSGTTKREYRKTYKTTNEDRFEVIVANTGVNRIRVYNLSKSYQVESSGLSVGAFFSGTATNGQVLTSLGNGNCAWQNVSSGKYYHKITYEMSVAGNGGFRIFFDIINNDSTAYTTASQVISALYPFTNVYKGGTGIYNNGNQLCPIYAIKSDNTNITIYYTDMTSNVRFTTIGTATYVEDVVVTL